MRRKTANNLSGRICQALVLLSVFKANGFMTQKIWSGSFVLLTLSNFLMCITYYSLISTLPIYLAVELHASHTTVGIVLAVYTIASVIIRPFTGFTLDRFGRKFIFMGALFLYSSLFAGYLMALTIPLLILLRFGQGLTWGVATIASSTVAVDITPVLKRGEGIGYFALSTTLGMSVGPVLGLYICHQWGYVAMFTWALITGMVAFGCAFSMKYPRRSERGRDIAFNLLNLFDGRSFIPSLNLFVIMITYGGLLSFIALYGKEIGIQNTSMFFFVFAVGIGLSRLFAGKEFDRNGPGTILTICLGLMVVGFPFLALVRNPLGFYGAAILIGFGIGVVFPIFQAMVNNLATSDRRGAANSTLYTALDLGMGLGMVVMGVISEHTSISFAFLVSALICVLGLALFRGVVLKYYEVTR
ncbi:MAG: MFS transporter [Bacteroidota bacterium]|nr:MFS transporter [Bacteroidota bacterium]